MREIEIRRHGWFCPKCNSFRCIRIRAICQSGVYERRCICGFRVRLEISMEKKFEWRPEIQNAEPAS